MSASKNCGNCNRIDLGECNPDTKTKKRVKASFCANWIEIYQAPYKEDNWRDRSSVMKCKTCMFFLKKITPAVQPANHVIGRCRRCAPTMKGWPVLFSDDWCGEHKLDETKL